MIEIESERTIMSDYSPVWPHGEIVKEFEGIYVVRGTNLTSYQDIQIQHSRNMIIIESGNNLTLINTVRLDEEGLKKLDNLGTVKQIMRIGAYHGRDDRFYLDRYEADFWTVSVDEKEANTRNYRVHHLANGNELPIKNSQFFMFEHSLPAEGFLYIDAHEGIIITCDSIKNWTKVDKFFSEDTAKLALASGEISKARISSVWVNATGVQKADFECLLKLRFKHLISAHGDILRNTAYNDVRDSVAQLR